MKGKGKSQNDPQKTTYGGRVFWQTLKRIRGCGSKKRYPNEDMAKNVAQRMKDITGDEFNTYFCQHCHFWHTGRDHKKMGERGYNE
jgi:hypothetical protein